jgi:FG-GAP repeat
LRSAIRLFFLVVLILVFAESRRALALFVEEQRLDGVGGHSIAINGNRVVIGDPAADSAKGAVYVYSYNQSTLRWEEEQILVASNGEAGDQFGVSLALADDRIVVGAPGSFASSTYKGAVYVFRFTPLTGWEEEQKLTQPDSTAARLFGFSTAMSGDRIAVGSPLAPKGAVHVYHYSPLAMSWVEHQKLVASDRILNGTHLGISVAMEGNRIVAGDWRAKHNDVNSGSAYVFRYDDSQNIWSEEAKLAPADGVDFGLFGIAVGISHERIVVGTQFAELGSADYVFHYVPDTQAWVLEKKLIAPSGGADETSHYALAIDGDRIVRGEPSGDTSRGGLAHVFRFNSESVDWEHEQELRVIDDNRFGWSVDVAGDLIAIGSPGSTYIFRFTPDSDGDGVPDDQDQCLNSDIKTTIIIGTCDSGVANAVLTEPTGCTITDEVLKLAEGANSNGQFVSRVDKFLGELQKAGILEPNEKNAIKDCAVQSSLP